eukprot:5004454-Pleurochrysis_carterae.AAC.2
MNVCSFPDGEDFQSFSEAKLERWPSWNAGQVGAGQVGTLAKLERWLPIRFNRHTLIPSLVAVLAVLYFARRLQACGRQRIVSGAREGHVRRRMNCSRHSAQRTLRTQAHRRHDRFVSLAWADAISQEACKGVGERRLRGSLIGKF